MVEIKLPEIQIYFTVAKGIALRNCPGAIFRGGSWSSVLTQPKANLLGRVVICILLMSFFSGQSSGSIATQVIKRSEVMRSLYNQINWDELIKSEVLRQRDVSHSLIVMLFVRV